MIMQVEDSQILEHYKVPESRDKSIAMLIEKYQQKLYWHIRKIVIDHDDADDVLQNTFIKAWKGLANFNELSALYTWLYRIATNEALQLLRTRAKQNNISIEDVQYKLADSLHNDLHFKGDEIQRKLQAAILALPEKQRIVFNMRYYDETPYEAMSEILETSVGALKASYHHAAKKIENFVLNH
jgi:RNA polymerase sigma factor (sigma-70 family)